MQESRSASRGTLFSWALFDFANTGFYVIIITVIFPTFFTDVIAGGNPAYWARSISASMLVTALLGPVLGSIADATNRKKVFLAIFTAACVIATVGLYFMNAETFWIAVLLVIIANVGFEGGLVFYDAFLPEIAPEKDYGKVSGYGFALGYAGSLAILMVVLPIISGAPGQADYRLTFLVAAGFFALFSLPMFLKVPEERLPPQHPSEKSSLIRGYLRLRETFTHIRKYRGVARFLTAFFVYNDAILTVILFASIFAQEELGLSAEDRIYFFMIVQVTALIGSLLFGWLTNYIGARQGIIITLIIWIGVAVAAFFTETREMFYIVGAVAGISLGSSQSTSRALMALLTPPEKKTEFFGFYQGFFGKASAVIGPLIFGEVARIYDLRTAILVVGVLFLVGALLLLRVPDVRTGQAAGA